MSSLAAAHTRKKQLSSRLLPLEVMVDRAIAFLREHEPPEGYFVGFSGGKDSIVTLKLVEMSGVRHKAYYSATGIDPPEVIKFIRKHYPEIKWLYPKYSFREGIRRKFPPYRVTRWCCDVLKKNPAKRIPLKTRIMGLRAEESNARRSLGPISVFNGLTIVKPIFNWVIHKLRVGLGWDTPLLPQPWFQFVIL